MRNKTFLQYLLQQKYLTKVQLEQCIQASQSHKKNISQILLQQGLLSQEQLQQLIQQFKESQKRKIPKTSEKLPSKVEAKNEPVSSMVNIPTEETIIDPSLRQKKQLKEKAFSISDSAMNFPDVEVKREQITPKANIPIEETHYDPSMEKEFEQEQAEEIPKTLNSAIDFPSVEAKPALILRQNTYVDFNPLTEDPDKATTFDPSMQQNISEEGATIATNYSGENLEKATTFDPLMKQHIYKGEETPSTLGNEKQNTAMTDVSIPKEEIANSNFAAVHHQLATQQQIPKEDLHETVTDNIAQKKKVKFYQKITSSLNIVSATEDRYRVLETLGEGGMGVVQLVKDCLLHREIALKRIKATQNTQKTLSTTQQINLWRLKREAEITAILEHPNIVPLYDMQKRSDGELYFTMRKVEGETLSALLKKIQLHSIEFDENRLLSIFFKICDAISYAHNQMIIHRDLKPDNIMLGTFGEVYVMDWGIAKRLEESFDTELDYEEEESLNFQTIGGIGTPGYMPPEQTENARQVQPQADIYALGMTLRQCYILLPPAEELKFEIKQSRKKRKIMQYESNVSLESLDSRIPQDIQAIIAKATHQNWDERYKTVQELVADIERYLKNLQVSVRNYSQFEIFLKYGKRNWKNIVVVFSILILGFFWFVQVRSERDRALKAEITAKTDRDRAQEAAVLARKQKKKAVENEKKALENAVNANIQKAQYLWSEGQQQKACLVYAHAIVEGENGNISKEVLRTARLWLAYRFPEYPHCKKIFSFKEAGNSIQATMVFHPEETHFVSGGKDAIIRFWDIQNQTFFALPKNHTESINSLAFQPGTNGTILASGSRDGTILLWNLTTKQCAPLTKKLLPQIFSMVFSEDGKFLVAACSNGSLYVFDFTTKKIKYQLKGHQGAVMSVDIHQGLIASAGVDRVIRLWDLATGKQLRKLRGHIDLIRSVSFDPEGKRLASGGHDGTTRLWEVKTGNLLATLQGHSHWIYSVAFSPNGRTLATGNWNSTIHLWDISTKTIEATLKGHQDAIYQLSYDSKGTLASVGLDRAIRLWKTETTRTQAIFHKRDYRGFLSLDFSKDGKTLATGSIDGTINFWQIYQSKAQSYRMHQGQVQTLSLHPYENLVVSAGSDGKVILWEPYTKKIRATLIGHKDAVTTAIFSPDGKRIATSGRDNMVHVWDVRTGRLTYSLKKHENWVWSIIFSPDGKQLITSCDSTYRFWEAQTGKLLKTLNATNKAESPGVTFSVVLSPDKRYLAGGRYNGTIWLWDLKKETLKILRGHASTIRAVAFSPDSQTLASGSSDGTVRLWEVSIGKTKTIFKGHTDTIYAVAFSPTSDHLASASNDGTVRIWRTFYHKEFLTLPAKEIQQQVENATGYTLAEGTFLVPLAEKTKTKNPK